MAASHTLNNGTLLVVDDDRELRELVSRFLSKHQFDVDAACDSAQAQDKLKRKHYDLIILDIMMPGEDGLSLCRRLRSRLDIPVIMLTAIGDDTDRIVGLEMGADDYLTKPFNPRELLARIKAVLRRTRRNGENEGDNHPAGQRWRFEQWRLDSSRRELTDDTGEPVDLTAGEYELLMVFLMHPQRVLNRDQLLEQTKGRSAAPFDRSIDVQLSRLRRKIESDPKNPKLIKTVRGGGYMFTAKVSQS